MGPSDDKALVLFGTMSVDRTVEHRGCPIAVTVRGSGPAVLFIQGVGVQGDGWLPQTDELSSGFTCISFDNRGMGRSVPAAAPITVAQMAEDAVALLDALEFASAHVVGHSLGGTVAVQLALLAPTRIKSLSLLCTFARGKDVAPLSARMMWWGLRSKVGTRAMRRRGFLGIVLPPGPADFEAAAEKLSTLFGHDLADQPPVVSDQLRALRAADTTPRLHELTGLPTLVVSATHDPIAPPAAGHVLRDGIPGARYVEVVDASHGLPITHAAFLNGLLRDHLQEADPKVGAGGQGA